MKLQYLISIVALALTAQASSNSTNVSSTHWRDTALRHHPRSWLNATAKDVSKIDKRNATVFHGLNNTITTALEDGTGMTNLID
ncbi:uncharacterized protein ATNIH1004_000381 [Aspergillus tanneri]|uniref:Uncharacterized protein n=1 Tax=Aspergillus tanneri TaxID=1220188 RepID=A0A5M9N2T0_9EURO|nr:uncharacterized protein ATNIH1004_000381 [Aspergillus tanneri]KAA8651493.1 hypothetical protein ATNIH1004_000381 [Aspergillus tanneri]